MINSSTIEIKNNNNNNKQIINNRFNIGTKKYSPLTILLIINFSIKIIFF